MKNDQWQMLTGDTVMPATEIGTFRTPAFASAPVATVEVDRAHICDLMSQLERNGVNDLF